MLKTGLSEKDAHYYRRAAQQRKKEKELFCCGLYMSPCQVFLSAVSCLISVHLPTEKKNKTKAEHSLSWNSSDTIANRWFHRLLFLVSALVWASRHWMTCRAREQQQKRDLECGKETRTPSAWLSGCWFLAPIVLLFLLSGFASGFFPLCSFAFQSDCFLYIHVPGYQLTNAHRTW